MNRERRSFLQGLFAVPFLLGAKQAAARATVHYDLNLFHIAGFQYYRGPRLISGISTGESLSLSAEPDNPHDAFAVRIERRGVKLSFVPRSDNKHLSRLLGQGAKLTCRVTRVNPQAPPWQMLEVAVGMAA
ncbi:HIRAN domain-containing protein [Geoalkalibacter sp.]|uniref:HIRAN domain-containing protein n=1 Tax=Geoalkalibacter sp. TaxID=3041440 RepID=UPI00272E80CA|nr:HIRAN domain-containing protein [Geoalkalibacter sp.]